jgi:hypothetical protein
MVCSFPIEAGYTLWKRPKKTREAELIVEVDVIVEVGVIVVDEMS